MKHRGENRYGDSPGFVREHHLLIEVVSILFLFLLLSLLFTASAL